MSGLPPPNAPDAPAGTHASTPPPHRRYDTAPGIIAVTAQELPPLPDEAIANPEAGRLDPRRWFLQPELPFEIEIGCGKGTFIVEQSKAQPDANFLGIEWEGEFCAYAADRLRRSGVTNARMLHADAVEFLRWRCPPAIVRVVHLYFSDPWPKAKHHKNRVVQDRFLAEVWRVLAPSGELRIVTDHDDYWTWMEERFARWTDAQPHPAVPATLPQPPFERSAFTPPQAAGEGELVGTNFERKYRREGRPFHACVLRKRS